jgi:hypothetical protein
VKRKTLGFISIENMFTYNVQQICNNYMGEKISDCSTIQSTKFGFICFYLLSHDTNKYIPLAQHGIPRPPPRMPGLAPPLPASQACYIPPPPGLCQATCQKLTSSSTQCDNSVSLRSPIPPPLPYPSPAPYPIKSLLLTLHINTPSTFS